MTADFHDKFHRCTCKKFVCAKGSPAGMGSNPLTGKITISPLVLTAAQFYLEGMKAGALAKDLDKISDTYLKIHRGDENGNAIPDKGIYIITTTMSVQNSGLGLSWVTTTTSYYDVSTKQYLGETTTR